MFSYILEVFMLFFVDFGEDDFNIFFEGSVYLLLDSIVCGVVEVWVQYQNLVF